MRLQTTVRQDPPLDHVLRRYTGSVRQFLKLSTLSVHKCRIHGLDSY